MSVDWLELSSSTVIYRASLVGGEETGRVKSIISKERQHCSALRLGGEAAGEVSWGPHGYIVGKASETGRFRSGGVKPQARNPRPRPVPSRLTSRDLQGQIAVH